jgi:diguanylate cyclase (GGDEF)-like protein
LEAAPGYGSPGIRDGPIVLMNFDQWFSLPDLILLAAFLVMAAMALRVLRMPAFSGRDALAGILASAGFWALGAAFDTMPIPVSVKAVAAGLTWLPILCTPAFWLLFTWQYVKGEIRPIPRAWLLPHLVMLILTVGMALTNQRHHLIYASALPLGDLPSSPNRYVHGPMFFVVATYIYVLMIFGVALIADAIQKSKGVYRRQYLAMATAMLLPWMANLCNVTGWFRPFGIDPTPISFLAMGAVIASLIGRNQLFNLVPIARSILVDAIPDPVVVLDRHFEVVDANAAAFALAGVSHPVIGKRLSQVAVIGEPLAEVELGGEVPTDLSLAERSFEVTLIPLSHGGRQVGTMLLMRDITRRARLETRLREQATRDTLTGLHNRRLLEEIGNRLVVEANQKSQPLAVIMLDLDHFKRLNDHHGHRAGDLVLRTIGGFLLERVRQTDFVFRTGGEEILILLPGANATAALARIESWRREFTAIEIAIGADGRVRTTFSAGIAIYPDDGEDLERVLLHADKALYRAKDQGRNQACVWREDALQLPFAAAVALDENGGADHLA